MALPIHFFRHGVFLGFIFSLCCHANANHLMDMSLEELLTIPITGATLTNSTLQSAPASVTVFTQNDIQTMPVSTLEELMNFAPGFQAYRSTDISNHLPFSTRGKQSSSATADVLVLMNGARIDNPFSGSLTIPYPAIPLANIERVEFIRGPGSSLYGSNAYMGVINIITLDRPSYIYAEAGSDDHYTTGVVNRFRSDQVSGSVFLEAKKDNGQHYQVENQFGDGNRHTRDAYKQLDTLLNFTIYNNTRLQLIANKRDISGFYTLGVVDDDINHWQSHYYNIMLEHKFQITAAWESTFQIGYMDMVFDTTTRSITPVAAGSISIPASDDPLIVNPFIRSQEHWFRSFNNITLDEKRDIQFGLEYLKPSIKDAYSASNYDLGQLLSGNIPINYYGDLSYRLPVLSTQKAADIYGALIQYQDQLTQSLKLTAGLRYDYYSYSDEQFSPRLGLVYQFDSHNTLKFVYGQAYRAPKYNELFSINSTVQIGNENLTSETVETWEAIWTQQWHQSFISLTLYHNDFRDIIIRPVEDNIRTQENGPGSSSNGAELEANWKPTNNVFLRGSLSRVFSQPQPDREDSDTLFSLIINYQISAWTLSLASHYASPRTTQFDQEIQSYDAYWIADMKFSLNLGNGLIPYLDIRNIADVDYTTPASTSSAEQGTPNRGRELRLGFNWEY
jgi:outer membrane receptor protein involved in Fe transport